MPAPTTPCHPLRRVASALALAASLFTPWAVHANGWAYCAAEGQLCAVPGAATVRFGANGQHEYRQVNGPVPCNTQTFGDPAKGTPKQCEYRLGQQDPSVLHPGGWMGGSGPNGRPIPPNEGWQVCALEGETCQFRGTREVRFGAADGYAVRSATGGIACDTRYFGDPAPGLRKMCLIRADAGWTGSSQPPLPTGGYPTPVPSQGQQGHWRFCADEDQQCSPPRGATVRFGAGGKYAVMSRVSGSVFCHVSTFGDPNPGERKRCEYSVTGSGWNTGGDWFGGQSGPIGAAGNWVYCAQEDTECRVPYPTAVRFGTDGRFHTLQVSSSVPCTPAVFGDPAKGERKRCEYAR